MMSHVSIHAYTKDHLNSFSGKIHQSYPEIVQVRFQRVIFTSTVWMIDNGTHVNCLLVASLTLFVLDLKFCIEFIMGKSDRVLKKLDDTSSYFHVFIIYDMRFRFSNGHTVVIHGWSRRVVNAIYAVFVCIFTCSFRRR